MSYLARHYRTTTTQPLPIGREASVHTVVCPICRNWTDVEEVVTATDAALARLLDDQTDRWTTHVGRHTLGDAISRITQLEAEIDRLSALQAQAMTSDRPSQPSSSPG